MAATTQGWFAVGLLLWQPAPWHCTMLSVWQVNSLDDMRRFILEHSDFSRAQSNVTKHVNIVTQLSEIVTKRSLMEVSTVSTWQQISFDENAAASPACDPLQTGAGLAATTTSPIVNVDAGLLA